MGYEESPLQNPKELYSGFIPLYFLWASGRPYLYQHETVVGAYPSDLVPNVEPVFAFSSDIKAHLFHGSFSLNMSNPTPGKESLSRELSSSSGDFVGRVKKQDGFIFSSFNYTALSGVDYNRYSFSGGYYYPVFGIQLGGEKGLFREIPASGGSPALRLKYFGDDYEFKLLATYTNYDFASPTEKEISLYPSSRLGEAFTDKEQNEEWLDYVKNYTLRYMNRFDLTAHFFKIGIDWSINEKISLGLNQSIVGGAYHEQIQDSETIGAESFNNHIQFNHFVSSISFRQQFGSRVAFTFFLNNFIRSHEFSYENSHSRNHKAEMSFVVLFALLF